MIVHARKLYHRQGDIQAPSGIRQLKKKNRVRVGSTRRGDDCLQTAMPTTGGGVVKGERGMP